MPRRAYRGRGKLCAGKFRTGQGGVEAQHECVSGGSCDPHAAESAVKRDVLPECWGGQTGIKLSDED